LARGPRTAQGRGAGGGGPQDRPRYVSAAQAEGLCRDAGVAALTDELLGAVVGGVRPARPNGHGSAWETLLGREEQISTTIF